MTTDTQALPWRCPSHPDALIRHEWDRTREHYRLTGVTSEWDHRHTYHCNDCGLRLAPPSEYPTDD